MGTADMSPAGIIWALIPPQQTNPIWEVTAASPLCGFLSKELQNPTVAAQIPHVISHKFPIQLKKYHYLS